MNPSLHFLPLVALATILPSCNDQEQINSLQSEIRSLSEKQMQSQSEANRLKMQFNAIEKERENIREEKSKLEADLEQARKALEQVQKDFAAYRSQYKLSMRTRGVGKSLGDLLVEGHTYRNAMVKEVTEELLSVMHESGMKKFDWNNVPDPVRRMFGLEKPGEYKTISFSSGRKTDRPLTKEEQIAKYDFDVREIERQIKELQRETIEIKKTVSDTRFTLSKSKAKSLPTVEIERSLNAYETRMNVIGLEIRTLEQKQMALLKQDPRRTRL